MLCAYGFAQNALVEHPADAPDAVLKKSVWLDLVEPSFEEEKRVEEALGFDIPTRGELEEIEASSRLYQEDGATFMTANLIRRGEEDRPESSAVTFIIKGGQLITIRYHHPQAFPQYVKQAMRQASGSDAWSVFISLIEAVVDRAADHLERVGQIVDDTSRQVFSTSFIRKAEPARRKRKPKNLEALLGKVGEEGDFTSKMRESLVSISRMMAFAQAVVDNQPNGKPRREALARIKIVQRDILSLTDHSTFLSGKISFLLDAVLGMISIEQNNIIKIFTVASVAFLPPTLVASAYGMNFKAMPELDWAWGYPYAIILMVASAVVPILYFKRKGWF
ncbi:MAG: magnesium transporter CorA family protein [Alphaproteobacteria bacterium]|nr:magnesium transporter CorA family protein [Alphaproteobacteria bacterium]